MNRGIIIGAVVVVVLALGGWYLLNNMPVNTSSNGENQNNGSQANGTIILSVTDAAANMGTITNVDMSVDRVYLHSAAQGWVLVSQSAQTFSLLDLKSEGQLALLANIDVAVDTYDQVWLHITGVKVTQAGKVIDATMPTGDFKVSGVMKVYENTTSTATIDVLADESLFVTDTKAIVFAPVVKFESRSNATATVDANNMVVISGGTIDASVNAGMDVSGEVKTNFKIDADSVLQINDGVLEIKGATNTETNINLGN